MVSFLSAAKCTEAQSYLGCEKWQPIAESHCDADWLTNKMTGGTQHRYIQDMERRKLCLLNRQLLYLFCLSPFQKEIIELQHVFVKGSAEPAKPSRCAGLACSKLLAHTAMGLWLTSFPFLIFGPFPKHFKTNILHSPTNPFWKLIRNFMQVPWNIP